MKQSQTFSPYYQMKYPNLFINPVTEAQMKNYYTFP